MHIVGSTAIHSDTARKPCARAFASTMPRGFNGVKKSRGKVPSRRSRLRQSAVSKGTKIQVAQNRVRCRLPKTLAPPPVEKNGLRVANPVATIIDDSPSNRRE